MGEDDNGKLRVERVKKHVNKVINTYTAKL